MWLEEWRSPSSQRGRATSVRTAYPIHRPGDGTSGSSAARCYVCSSVSVSSVRTLRRHRISIGRSIEPDPVQQNREFARQGNDCTLGLPSFGNVLRPVLRSEEHTSELQSLMRISYAVFCLKKKKNKQ